MPDINIQEFTARELLRVDVLPRGRYGVPFLNWKVTPIGAKRRLERPPEQFVGAGLYGVCFKGALIYVGKYLGERPKGQRGATLRGDIVRARWWQHFGSFTGRSHKLHVAPRALQDFIDEHGDQHFLSSGLSCGMPELSRDAGCLGALNRLHFAARHWNDFGTEDPAEVIGHFQYVYARLPAFPGHLDGAEVACRIATAEVAVTERLQPVGNTAGRNPTRPLVSVPSGEVGAILAEALRNHLA